MKAAFISSLALLASALPLSAQITQTQEADLAPLRWPSTPRPAIELSEYRIDFDGAMVPMLLIKCGSTVIELANRQTLGVNTSAGPRHSGVFTDDAMPGIAVGFSFFPKNEFLPDLGDESWERYKATLQSDKPTANIVFESDNLERSGGMYVFGQKFRQLAYESEGTNGTNKKREIFAFIGSSLLVITVEGSKENVDLHWAGAQRLFGEMSLQR